MAVKAYVLLNTDLGKVEDVVKAVSDIQGVKSADSVTGPYDVIACIEAENYEALMELVPEKIHKVEGITKTLTCIATG